jgi:hypothetical protein
MIVLTRAAHLFRSLSYYLSHGLYSAATLEVLPPAFDRNSCFRARLLLSCQLSDHRCYPVVMQNNRGRTTVRKYQQPRRTHTLGGCSTCRRRHVKCDQARPTCSVCRNANLQCGGFPSSIRWASMSTGPPAPKLARAPQRAPFAQSPSTPQSTTAEQNVALTQPSQCPLPFNPILNTY